MIITFYRHRRVFALAFHKFRANVHRPSENQLAIAKPVTFPHLEKEKVHKCKMGKTFMVILPGVSVVVEFYSVFNFRERRGNPTFSYWPLHKHSAADTSHSIFMWA